MELLPAPTRAVTEDANLLNLQQYQFQQFKIWQQQQKGQASNLHLPLFPHFFEGYFTLRETVRRCPFSAFVRRVLTCYFFPYSFLISF